MKGDGGGEVLLIGKAVKIYEIKDRNLNAIHSFPFSIAAQWAGLESSAGWFCPPGLMFDTSDLDYFFSQEKSPIKKR